MCNFSKDIFVRHRAILHFSSSGRYCGDDTEWVDIAHFVSLIARSIRLRMLLSAATIFAICKPARLKALLGEMQVAECNRNSSERDAKRCIIVTFICQLTMYFICDYKYSVS